MPRGFLSDFLGVGGNIVVVHCARCKWVWANMPDQLQHVPFILAYELLDYEEQVDEE
jgi:hypothetical protein